MADAETKEELKKLKEEKKAFKNDQKKAKAEDRARRKEAKKRARELEKMRSGPFLEQSGNHFPPPLHLFLIWSSWAAFRCLDHWPLGRYKSPRLAWEIINLQARSLEALELWVLGDL